MSNIPDNLKTPGTYFDVNTNTQRTGLPANTHKVLFVTQDSLFNNASNEGIPLDIYDKTQADLNFGKNSHAGRMITSAIKTNRTINVQCINEMEAQPSDCIPSNIVLSNSELSPTSAYVLTYDLNIASKNIDLKNIEMTIDKGFGNAISALLDAINEILVSAGTSLITSSGGIGLFRGYAHFLLGGDGSVESSPATITLKKTPRADVEDINDLFDYLMVEDSELFFENQFVIHSCGNQQFI